MATRFKNVIALLAAVMVVATAACAGDPPVPTPNLNSTVEARVKQEVAAQPTASPVVVVKEIAPTDTPIPTDTPVRTAVPTPKYHPLSLLHTLPPRQRLSLPLHQYLQLRPHQYQRQRQPMFLHPHQYRHRHWYLRRLVL